MSTETIKRLLQKAYDAGYEMGVIDERLDCILLCDGEVNKLPRHPETEFDEGQISMGEYLSAQIRNRSEVK